MNEQPLPYVPIDPLIAESEKFQRFVEFADLYDDPMALLYIINLLLYAGRKAVDGNLGHLPDRAIARNICKYGGDATAFVAALKDSAWLEESKSGLVIRKWDDWGGRAYKERVRKRGGKPAQEPPEAPSGDLPEVPGDLPEVPGSSGPKGKGKGSSQHTHAREDVLRIEDGTLEQAGSDAGYGAFAQLKSGTILAIRKLGDVTRKEFDEAAATTALEADTPCWTYWLRVASGRRNRPRDGPRPKKPEKRDLQYGSADVSTFTESGVLDPRTGKIVPLPEPKEGEDLSWIA